MKVSATIKKTKLDIRELRIGSYLMGCNGKVFQLDRYAFVDLELVNDGDNGCPSPVPIDNTTLSKIGWVQNYTHKSIYHYQGKLKGISGIRYNTRYQLLYIFIAEKSEYEPIHLKIKVRYLHQLQNAVFTIIGEEIKIVAPNDERSVATDGQ